MAGFHDDVRKLSGDVDVDLFESEESYLLVIDLPGAIPAETTVTTRAGHLRIATTREKNYPADARIVREDRSLTFEFEVPLPRDVEDEGASASLSDGVLEVELPRGEPGTTIPIEDE